jgi:ribosome-associated toxin RatA of RatAB toxin-antitoxin module
MAAEAQTYTTTVAATPADCFAVVTDFPSYPRWSGPICRADVRESYPDGLAKRVELELDMKIRRVRYVLEYRYEPPGRVAWKLVEGDLNDVEGSYVFEAAGAGATKVTCTQAVDLGFWIPGFIRSTIERGALRDAVEEFKRETEARAGRRSG